MGAPAVSETPVQQPTGLPIPPTGPLSLGRFLELLAMDAAAAQKPRVPFQPPELPPGVYGAGKHPLAFDSACGGVDTYGWLNAQAAMCGLGFPGYAYLSNLAQRAEYRAPTEVIASEMTREWLRLTGGKENKLKELDKALDDFGVRDCIRLCVTQDGFFGRGQLFINIKGQEGDAKRRRPLLVNKDGATIGKGDLVGFKPIEPIWTTPYAYNSNNPAAPDFYKPESWYVMGRQTHASRLLTFISRPVPDVLKPSYNFSGMSLSQLIEPYVQRWLKTVDSVNRLISNFSVSGLATNMQATLAEGKDSELFKRAALFNQLRDNRGLMLTDKDAEEFFQFNTPLSGLSELQAQAQEHMAAPTHIPLVKLTGITPSGLNASSEGEIKVFYDWIASEQENLLTSHVQIILRVLQLHLWGKVDESIGFEWIPLDSPTDKELAEMRKSDGERDKGYIDAGVLSPDEVRDRLRGDPNSGYTGIEGDAPPPPLEQEYGLNEAGAQAAHERGEESAEASAAREAEAREHAAKLDKKLAKDAGFKESDHPRDRLGKFSGAGSSPTGDPAHLIALQTRLAHEKERYQKDKSKIRAVWISQVEKEIEREKKFLGLTNDLPDMTDEELLRDLES